jgi:hypothetical protein
MQSKSRSSNRRINRCCRVSWAICIFQTLFRRKHPGRVHVLSTTSREMYREWYIQGSGWLLHSRRYFLGKMRRHLYRRSSNFDRTQERLSSWGTAYWSPRELYTFIERLSITWPITKIAFCARRGGESRERCKSSPNKLSLIFSFVLGKMRVDHKSLILHSEMRWSSKGKSS